MRLVRVGSTDRWVNPEHVVELLREDARAQTEGLVTVRASIKMVGMPLDRITLAENVAPLDADAAWSAFLVELQG